MRDWPIILTSVVAVAALGVFVFFWWRRRYGVWARSSGPKNDWSRGNREATIIPASWGHTPGPIDGRTDLRGDDPSGHGLGDNHGGGSDSGGGDGGGGDGGGGDGGGD